MDKAFLDHILKVRLPILIGVVLFASVFSWAISRNERHSVGFAPEQPIKYSHKMHAGDLKIDCLYCHVGADKSRHATVPSPDICMNCHTQARTDKPEVQKLIQYYNEGKPIPWKRVNKLPEHVYFSHSVHVNKGVDCNWCHGGLDENANTSLNVQQMEVIEKVRPFHMGDCFSCHDIADLRFNKPNVSVTPPGNCIACHR